MRARKITALIHLWNPKNDYKVQHQVAIFVSSIRHTPRAIFRNHHTIMKKLKYKKFQFRPGSIGITITRYYVIIRNQDRGKNQLDLRVHRYLQMNILTRMRYKICMSHTYIDWRSSAKICYLTGLCPIYCRKVISKICARKIRWYTQWGVARKRVKNTIKVICIYGWVILLYKEKQFIN